MARQELLEAVLKKVSSWDKAEKTRQAAEDEALAAETSPGAAQGLSMEEQLAKKRQIFAPQEAYKMLVRELKDMMLEPSNGVAVDAIGNSVWQWDMKLRDFDPSTPIAQVVLGLSDVMQPSLLQLASPACIPCLHPSKALAILTSAQHPWDSCTHMLA